MPSTWLREQAPNASDRIPTASEMFHRRWESSRCRRSKRGLARGTTQVFRAMPTSRKNPRSDAVWQRTWRKPRLRGTTATAAYAKQVARPKNRPDPTHQTSLPASAPDALHASQHAEGDKRQSRKLGADAQRGGIEDGKHVQDECNIGSSAWVRKLPNKTEAGTRRDKAPERSSQSPDHVGLPIDAGELSQQRAVPAGPSK